MSYLKRSRWQSFLMGFSRLFGGVSSDADDILAVSDIDAMRSDWEAVGNDMWNAVRKFETEHITEAELVALRLRKAQHDACILVDVNEDAPRPDNDSD